MKLLSSDDVLRTLDTVENKVMWQYEEAKSKMQIIKEELLYRQLVGVRMARQKIEKLIELTPEE